MQHPADVTASNEGLRSSAGGGWCRFGASRIPPTRRLAPEHSAAGPASAAIYDEHFLQNYNKNIII